jgi:hypothetical protein
MIKAHEGEIRGPESIEPITVSQSLKLKMDHHEKLARQQ